MRKRLITAVAGLTAVCVMMAACGGSTAPAPQQTGAPAGETAAAETAAAAADAQTAETAQAAEASSAETKASEEGPELPEITRRSFISEEEAAPEVKAELPEQKIDADLGNVVNVGDFYFEDGAKKMLAENGFYVSQYGSYEFWSPMRATATRSFRTS